MKLTRFPKLRKAIDDLDPAIVHKKLRQLDMFLLGDGLPLAPNNLAITQEGIFYIEPQSGIATKVIAYISEFAADLTPAQRANLVPEGYTDRGSIEKFHPYHLMRCNTITTSERNGWTEPYRITKRTDGKLLYRITSVVDPKKKVAPEVYQTIQRQQLYVCKYCFLKVSSILAGAQGEKREDFEAQRFFDVDLFQSWNSLGLLSKDHGFTTDMYPDDWLEICRVRKEQVGYRCESCYADFSKKSLRRYLCVNATDYVEDKDGYLRLECFCISCISELPGYAHVKTHPEYLQYQYELSRLNESRARSDDREAY